MKVVILAGGMGTRISEETSVRPKPMVEIGGKPMLWHIMKIYSHFGFNDFVICLGFKGYMIKEYFSNYFLHMSDVTFDMANNSMEVHQNYAEPWRVTLVDTGAESMTGGRIRRVASYLGNETFMLTYGDGLANVDIHRLLEFHRNHGHAATVTSTQPTGRFGAMSIGANNSVASFQEKPAGDGSWINGGFFVLEPSVVDRIASDATVFEREPLESLARDGELYAFKHSGFWQPMDTLRDKILLEELWNGGNAPWKIWD
ncbi:glucose-1-phosphate cytidylyltransferase [Geobacter sulfurreducens]|uniref:Glucose-1-phosphate cytidylyltransferase n=1 Tax=Geobacter metallireducens TaxID=28232 RepID=A0A831UCC1_GEOME|nr:glucose-1-phosphate cytidylyltransferase [Geobacter sulfurreducens]QVW34103.1 glucose-1-phosphate cytidylyltransferase [Geobacter sulfurreducens]